jgi:hypothetical protein
MLVADYGLLSLQELGSDGPRGPRRLIEGTLAGRCFASGEIVVSGHDPATVFVPLAEGSERLGVLELSLPAWSEDLRSVVGPVVRVLVLVLISKRRYTDVVLRARRAQPMGLGGAVKAVTTDSLQRGDRVLFYTDGVVESLSPEGEAFGVERLADLLVRTAADGISQAETVRRLAAAVLAYNRQPLRDDATFLLVEYHGPGASDGDG